MTLDCKYTRVLTLENACRRVWKLRSLIKEEEDGGYVSLHKGGAGGEAVKAQVLKSTVHRDYVSWVIGNRLHGWLRITPLPPPPPPPHPPPPPSSQEDYEAFLLDIETDAATRNQVNLYKDPAMWRISQDGSVVPGHGAAAAPPPAGGEGEEEGEEQDGGLSPLALLDALVLGEEDEEQGVGASLGASDDELDAPLPITNAP